MAKNIAIVFAGGVGARMGTKDLPKQFLLIENKPIIIHTIEHFDKHPKIDEIYIACVEEWVPYLEKSLKVYGITKVKDIIIGGQTPLHSVYNVLTYLKEKNYGDNDIVLLHDGVRPYITEEVITNNIESVELYGTAVTTTKAVETVILSEDGINIKDTPLRKNMFSAQAPQSFHLGDLIDSHEQIKKLYPNYENVVDSCTMYHLLGKSINMVLGNVGNIKITTERDYYILQGLLNYEKDGDFQELIEGQKQMMIDDI